MFAAGSWRRSGHAASIARTKQWNDNQTRLGGSVAHFYLRTPAVADDEAEQADSRAEDLHDQDGVANSGLGVSQRRSGAIDSADARDATGQESRAVVVTPVTRNQVRRVSCSAGIWVELHLGQGRI